MSEATAAGPASLEIWAERDGDGRVQATALVETARGIALRQADGVARPLPAAAIEATFTRYARPLAIALPARAAEDQAIAFITSDGARATVRAFAYRSWTDALPTDYLALEVEGREAVAAPARLVAAALAALARAAERVAGLAGEGRR